VAGGKVYKAPNRQGGITYRIRLDYVDPITGERKRPWETLKGITSDREAERYLQRKITEIEGGEIVSPSRRTVGELLVEWLDQHARSHVRPDTLIDYESTVRVHLVPAFGTVPMQKLTTARVQQWEDTYHAAGHGTRVVQLAHLRLKQAFDYAVRMGYVSRNVVQFVDPPRDPARKKPAWNRAERALFLTRAEHSVYYPLWHVALGAGLRRAELLALTWDRADLERGVITVIESKSIESTRQVPIQPELVEILKAHRTKQAEALLHIGRKKEAGLVLASSVGTPINPNNVSQEFARLVEGLKVRKLTCGIHSRSWRWRQA
jgi:integrase